MLSNERALVPGQPFSGRPTTGSLATQRDLGLRTPRSVRIMYVSVLVLLLLNTSSQFFLAEHTDRFFAWTVSPPLTAAFFGASSFGAAALLYLSIRQRWWVQARLGMVSPFVFSVALEVVTLVHLDKFHFDSPLLTARFAAWLWLVGYAVVPLWILAVAVLILRRRVSDPPRSRPLPVWLRTAALIQGLLLALGGVVLLFATTSTLELWPWELTPLTARAVGCWLLANAVLVIHAVIENDLDRLFPASVTLLVSATMQVVAVVRFADQIDAASAAGAGYLAFVASLLLFGLIVLVLRRRSSLAVATRTGGRR